MADKDNNKYTDEDVRNFADVVFDKLDNNPNEDKKKETIRELKAFREKKRL